MGAAGRAGRASIRFMVEEITTELDLLDRFDFLTYEEDEPEFLTYEEEMYVDDMRNWRLWKDIDEELRNRFSTVEEAMWAGDQARCYELAPCRCCCDEHTFFNCEARTWGGCLGQGVDEDGMDEDGVGGWRRAFPGLPWDEEN